ncbi:MAG: DASS family sodium-coupled anion symporter [Wenzhouxiangella sp.]|nr:MAG: DASS family sodium-coupled anion symporter [Wenzhouxiangella sp.]
MAPQSISRSNRRQRIGLWLGLLVFLTMLVLPEPANMTPAAWSVAALGALMAIWWISEAIPIPATALLPIVALPLLGVSTIGQATAPYANPLIFLFMGGFMIALAMQRWGLHKRIALTIIGWIGSSPQAIVLGFMIAAGFLSMWVSNTATALMMLPIALSAIKLARVPDNADPSQQATVRAFGITLVLGIAYACNIGGVGTLIGTPPNALMAGYMLESHGVTIGFAQWMMVGMPLVIVGIPLTYLLLVKVLFPLRLTSLPGGHDLIAEQRQALGPISRQEKGVAVVFTLTALLWITRPLLQEWIPGLSDAGIAMTAALALFLIPAGPRHPGGLLDWETTRNLPWGILILFGGGLSLAAAIGQTGLDESIGELVVALGGWPVVLLLTVAVALVIMLTEITSNTATAAAFLPVLGAAAIGLGQDPLLFAAPAALAASCAFMLPVATPPNAVVYSSGLLSIPMMARAGIWLNLIFTVLIVVLAYTVMGWVFGG